nr:hypothetical protein [Marinicella sp. W31]MDC2876568.1 hypothetical protein [Marinicella sp. W31]
MTFAGFQSVSISLLLFWSCERTAERADHSLCASATRQRACCTQADFRRGRGRNEGAFPVEIQPLADEINALLANNRAIVERARMQVGNLAHSLKTPIAVLLNEAQSMGGQGGKLIASQVVMMQAQVQAYLNRARIAAQTESVLTRCEIEPVLERLVRVMRRLNPETVFSLSCAGGLVLAAEQQDIEEIVGNLLENAARFAKRQVSVSAQWLEGLTKPEIGRRSLLLTTGRV